MSEQWISVKGYEGYYECSTEGRIKSLPKLLPATSVRHYIVKACQTGWRFYQARNNWYVGIIRYNGNKTLNCRNWLRRHPELK